jgi:hypothetical protein
VLAAAVLVSTLLPAPPAAAAAPIKVMPLGASITWGTSSPDGNGYREALRRQLADDADVPIDLVGSQSSGTMADKDNEGHPASGSIRWPRRPTPGSPPRNPTSCC